MGCTTSIYDEFEHKHNMVTIPQSYLYTNQHINTTQQSSTSRQAQYGNKQFQHNPQSIQYLINIINDIPSPDSIEPSSPHSTQHSISTSPEPPPDDTMAQRNWRSRSIDNNNIQYNGNHNATTMGVLKVMKIRKLSVDTPVESPVHDIHDNIFSHNLVLPTSHTILNSINNPPFSSIRHRVRSSPLDGVQRNYNNTKRFIPQSSRHNTIKHLSLIDNSMNNDYTHSRRQLRGKSISLLVCESIDRISTQLTSIHMYKSGTQRDIVVLNDCVQYILDTQYQYVLFDCTYINDNEQLQHIFDIIKQIRRIEKHRELPESILIILSDQYTQFYIQQCINSGCNGLIHSNCSITDALYNIIKYINTTHIFCTVNSNNELLHTVEIDRPPGSNIPST